MVVSVGVFEFHCVIIRCCKGGELGRCGSGREEERVRGMYVIYIYCELYGGNFQVSWMYKYYTYPFFTA